jgi:magnesium transporter
VEIRPHFQKSKPPPGSRPGVIVIPPDALPTSIHVIDYTRERVDEVDVADPAELARYRDPATITWIEVDGLGSEPVLRKIFEIFEIHPLAQADVVNVPQRPKADIYEAHDLVVLRMARARGEGECHLEQVSLLVGPDWVISVQEGTEDVFDPVRARIRQNALIRQMSADFLAYALIDVIIDGYYPVVDQLGEIVENLEDEVVDAPTRGTIESIHDVRRELLLIHRSMRQQRDAVNVLVRGESPRFSLAVRPYLRDAFDHVIQITEVLDGFREMSIGLMEVYLSSVSNRTNEIMRVLTVMSSIFIPLTFVVGVYGMNFDHMPELRWTWGYGAVWLVMLGVAGTLLGYFYRRGWIGTGRSSEPDADE